MALPPVAFWFLRHGQTDHNAAGLSQGSVDIPLNATGRAQAERAGPLLAGRGVQRIISSPLLRALETAEIINEFLRVDLNVDANLREVSFGGMEGKPLQPWFPDWLEGRSTPDGAESFAALTARVERAVTGILNGPAGPVLLVAHGGVFRAMRDLMGLPREGLTRNAVPFYCEPSASGWQVSNFDEAL